MRPRTAVSLALAALAGVLLVALISPRPPRPTVTEPLLGLASEYVSLIRLPLAGGETAELVRGDDDGWSLQLAEPVPAAPERVLRALALVGLRCAAPQVALPEDPESFALLPRVTLGQQELILLPADATTQPVRVDDRELRCPRGPFQQLLNLPLSDFAARRLLPPGTRIDAIEFPGLSVLSEPGGYRDAEGRADPAEVTALVAQWEAAVAESVEPAGAAAAQAPAIALRLAGAGEAVHLLVTESGSDGALTLMRPGAGLQYRFGPGSRQRLLQLPIGD